MDLKPDVCWQLPLRREDTTNPDGSVTSVVGQWDRQHWGAGGEEFAWWCTEAPEAFRGRRPVWRHMSDELSALIGPENLRPPRALPGGPGKSRVSSASPGGTSGRPRVTHTSARHGKLHLRPTPAGPRDRR